LTWRIQTAYNYSAPACAEGSGNQDDFLVSPPILLPDSNCRLVWWDKVENPSDNNSYRILLSTTGSGISDFSLSLDTVDCTNAVWTRHQLDISAYKDQTVYLAFHQFYSASEESNFALDNVYVDILPAGPVAQIEPLSLDFGPVNVTATSVAQSLSIRNRGIGTLTVTGAALVGSDEEQFILTDLNTYPVVLDPDETISVDVSFNPLTEGNKTTTLSVSHNVSGSPVTAQISGEAQVTATNWLGSVSDEWNNPANWSNGVPGPGSEAVILPGVFDPVVSGIVTVYRVIVSQGATVNLTLSGGLNVAGK